MRLRAVIKLYDLIKFEVLQRQFRAALLILLRIHMLNGLSQGFYILPTLTIIPQYSDSAIIGCFIFDTKIFINLQVNICFRYRLSISLISNNMLYQVDLLVFTMIMFDPLIIQFLFT